MTAVYLLLAAVAADSGAGVDGHRPLEAALRTAADAIKLQPKRGKFVFTTEKGTPVQPDRFTEDFAELKKTLGLPPETRLQDLRGSFVSLLIETGADLRTVIKLCGILRNLRPDIVNAGTPKAQVGLSMNR